MPDVLRPLLPPVPPARLPWSRLRDGGIFRDADNKPVSFVECADYLWHVQQAHAGLVAALMLARSQMLLRRCDKTSLQKINQALAAAGVAT